MKLSNNNNNNNNILSYSKFYSLDILTQSIILNNLFEIDLSISKGEGAAVASWITINNFRQINLKNVENLVTTLLSDIKKCSILNFNEIDLLSYSLVKHLKLKHKKNTLIYYNQFIELDLLEDFNQNIDILNLNQDFNKRIDELFLNNINLNHIETLLSVGYTHIKKSCILNFNFNEIDLLSDILVKFLKTTHQKNIDTYHNQFFELNFVKDFNQNIERLYSTKVWKKKLEKLWLRETEHSLRSQKKVKKYISNYTKKILKSIESKNFEKLTKRYVVDKKTGEKIRMSNLYIKTLNNKLDEIKFKNFVFQEKAKIKGFEFLFLTITLPSEYHNKKLNKTTREGHNDLNNYFLNFLKIINKKGMKSGDDYFYISTNEAHKDGCEHRHVMFFCKKDNFDLIKKYIKICYLNKFYSSKSSSLQKAITRILKSHTSEESKKQRIEKAKNKILNIAIKIVEEDKNRGGASSYIFKYILKNISEDGKHEERFNEVKYWSKLNSIRQFTYSGCKLNFSAYLYCQKVFNSKYSFDNVNKLKELHDFDEKACQTLDLLYSIFSKKKTNKNDRYFNFNKLEEFNKFDISTSYVHSKNKFYEETKKLDCVIINNVVIKNQKNYEIV